MEKLVRKIGLVAHDAMKKDLIEWVLCIRKFRI